MNYTQRIQRGSQRPSLFRSPLFYLSIIFFIALIALYQVTGTGILKIKKTQNLSLQLRRQGEALNHLLFHQFFILGLKKEDVKLNIRTLEKGTASWSEYQIEISLPETLSVQPVSESFNYQLKLSFPALSLQSRLLEHGKRQLIIQQDAFVLAELTFIPFSEKPPNAEFRGDITGRIAIVIDDLGPNLAIAHEFLALHHPLTFSILPFYTHSKDIAAEAHSQGREVMLHLPLEPFNKEEIRQEKGTLFTTMDKNKLLEQLREDLSALPYLSGVNGHMGSKFTGDRESMEIVLRELKHQELFFLDSLTTGKSVGSSVAINTGIRFGKRDLFLDRELGDKTIEDRIIQLSELARKRGYAIGIAHPDPDTLNTLKKMLSLLEAEGIEVVPVSQTISPLSN